LIVKPGHQPFVWLSGILAIGPKHFIKHFDFIFDTIFL